MADIFGKLLVLDAFLCSSEHPAPKCCKPRTSIACTLDEFQPMDLALDLSLGVRRRECCVHGCLIPAQSRHKRLGVVEHSAFEPGWKGTDTGDRQHLAQSLGDAMSLPSCPE